MVGHLVQCSRTLASSSSARIASIHTSAVLQAVSSRTRKSHQTLKSNIERREELERQREANRPHVVLGHKGGEEEKWLNSDLAKVLITAEDVRNSPEPGLDPSNMTVCIPEHKNYGIGEKEEEMLFTVLPKMTSEARLSIRGAGMSALGMVEEDARLVAEEATKSMNLARLVDLRNANARGFAYENRRRIVATFSEPENPMDTGRPEVQAAITTMEIRNLWDHLSRCKKDIANRRSLRRLVHRRAKILKYLKRVDEDRYDRILERLGLERTAVEGELVV